MVIERPLTQVAGRRTQVCQSQRLLGTCSLRRKFAAPANGSANSHKRLKNLASSAGQMLLLLHYQGFKTFIPTSENNYKLFLFACRHLDMSLSVELKPLISESS